MASNPAPKRIPHRFSPRARLIALAVLAALALADLGAIFFLHKPVPPAAPPPAPPVAALPAGPQGPAFDVVRVDPQGNTVIAGRGVPGATITILDNGKPLGTIVADQQGAFVFIPASPLGQGAHSITMSEALPDGTIITGQQNASVSLPGDGSQALTVLSGPNGSTVLSGQGTVPGQLGLGAVDYDSDGHAIFSGSAPPGATVQLRLGSTPIGQAMADAKGNWHITAPTPAAGGTLTLSATTAAGALLPAVTAPFAPETLRHALAAGHIVIAPGDNLWLIARHVYGNGVSYTLIYAANHGQIQNPNLIFPGQDFVLPKPKAN